MWLYPTYAYALLSRMTFVEPSFRYPPLVWGKDLRVTLSADRLTVSAEAPLFQEDAEAAPDLFRSYRKAVTRFGPQKRQGKNSPHIQFANAESDQQLEAFVRSFGPVVVSSFTSEEQAIESDGPLNFNRTKQIWMGEQDLAELRKERLVYRAALVLVAELKRG